MGIPDTSSISENRFGRVLASTLGPNMTFLRNVRPVWLPNPKTGRAMELDFFCPFKKLAIEYDGPQHYEFPNRYHATREEFEEQRERDAEKDRICAENGVRLIRVRMGATIAEDVGRCIEMMGCASGTQEEVERSERASAPRGGYAEILHTVETFAKEHRLRKVAKDEMVYAPVPGCPCAYVRFKTFEKFVPHVLKGHREYRANVRRAGEIETYLRKYEEDVFPTMEVDRGLISFANGVLVLRSNRFVPTPGGVAPPELEGRVARNHIPLEYTGGRETPRMDALLDRQFDESDGRKEMLYALLGRLLFRVNEVDSWEVMPLLMGQGGTGKSTILKVAQAMFASGAVGEMDSNNEGVFMLMGQHEKEVLFIRDAPAKMHERLPQEIWQKMVAGEGMQVPVKFKTAVMVEEWTVPIIAASNHMLDYENTVGQVSRRVVPFRFNNRLNAFEVDPNVIGRIRATELPNIIARCLSAYLELVESSEGRGFWSFCPVALREDQDDAASEASLVYKFLAAGGDEGATVRRREGAAVKYSAFKKVYDRFLAEKHPKMVKSPLHVLTKGHGPVFELLGYGLKNVNVCKGCDASPAHFGCCPEYSKANRVKIWTISDMELLIHPTPCAP